jgi:hypothetical protein
MLRLCRRVLVHLLPHAVDLDIENALFTTVSQKLQAPLPDDLKDSTLHFASHRTTWLSQHRPACNVQWFQGDFGSMRHQEG